MFFPSSIFPVLGEGGWGGGGGGGGGGGEKRRVGGLSCAGDLTFNGGCGGGG